MVCVGLLTSFFNKNMIVVLLVAVLSTALVNSRKIIEGMGLVEGFVESMEPKEKKDETTPPATEDLPPVPPAEEKEDKKVDEKVDDAVEDRLAAGSRARDAHKKSNEDNRKCYEKDDKGVWQVIDMVGDKCEPGTDETTCLGIDECKSLVKSGFSNMKSKNIVAAASTEARVDGKDDLVNRIDSKATMDQTVSNLNKVIGKGGIKGLTQETRELLEQQKELVQSLGQMAPILKSAKSTLDGLDLPDISGISNLIKGMNGN